MNFWEAIRYCFVNYTKFSGRASRSEFWYWVLFIILTSLMLSIVPILGFIFSIATFLPYLAVTCRRLHDTNRSGWWQLWVWLIIIAFIILFVVAPPIGVIGYLVTIIIFIVWLATAGDKGENRFGVNPLETNLTESEK